MLHFSVTGDGTPVVFLHGYMEDHTMWDFVANHTGIQAICIDLFGHGNSAFEEINETPSIDFMAKQVVEVLEHLKVDHPQVVGHSLGGYVALELLKLRGDIEHITFLHSHPWADSEQKKLDRGRVAELVLTKSVAFIQEAIPNLFHNAEIHRDTIQKYCETAKKMNPKAIAWSALAMRNRVDNSTLLAQFPDRFTIIQGRYDNLIPALEMSKLASETGVSYIELPNSGHMGHEEEQALCKEVLLSVLI